MENMKMKKNIEWHKECLKNQGISLRNERIKVSKLVESYKKSEERYNKLKMQIARAEKENKLEFDSDMYKPLIK